jgi:hypothetical protein
MLSAQEPEKVSMPLKLMISSSSVSCTDNSSLNSELRNDCMHSGLNMMQQRSEILQKKSKYVAIWSDEEVSTVNNNLNTLGLTID